MTVRATQIQNTSDHTVTVQTDTGRIELAPREARKNVNLDESEIHAHKELSVRIQLRD